MKFKTQNLDLIICESEDSNFLFYKKHYAKFFKVISQSDLNILDVIKKSKGLLFLSSSKNLDIVNFSQRAFVDSCKIYELRDDHDDRISDCIYPGQSAFDCADQAIYSGCFYLGKKDCQDFNGSLCDFAKNIQNKHIEAFNVTPFKVEEYERAIFLDRDGILNVDTGYTFEVSKLEVVPGVVDFLKKAKTQFQKFLVVTNQAGIAKGFYEEPDVLQFNEKLAQIYQRDGVDLSSFEYCPYHFDGEVAKYKKHSYLRKPNAGMIYKHLFKRAINLSESIMIGDRESDILRESLLSYYILESSYLVKEYKFKIYKNFAEISKDLFLS